jgi:lipid A 3-O-deacylase
VKSSLALIILFISCISLKAQSSGKGFRHELSVLVDNDYPYNTDQYYTAGQDVYYRVLINSKIPILHNNDSSKTILSIHYGNKVFTPKNVDTEDPKEMDRPYCGWNFISASLLNFRKRNSGNSFMVELGLVGKQSGMGELQLWLHQQIGLYSIYGWDSQITNEVVVNTNFIHTHGFQIKKKIELVSSSKIWLGTGSNKLSEELILRFFRFNPLGGSAFMSANISNEEYSTRKREFFFFASLEGSYVFSNIFIEGSLFNNPSPYTLEATPWTLARKFGVQYSSKIISASFSITHLSKETDLMSTHDYASISLAYRF